MSCTMVLKEVQLARMAPDGQNQNTVRVQFEALAFCMANTTELTLLQTLVAFSGARAWFLGKSRSLPLEGFASVVFCVVHVHDN